MDERLCIEGRELDEALSDWDYIHAILDRYEVLWHAEPDRLMQNFSDEQISLVCYGRMCNQITNGGFVQLLFNGFADSVYNSPLMDDLDRWGAVELVWFLMSIKQACLAAAGEMAKKEHSLETLAGLYAQYPELEAADAKFYSNDGSAEIRAYIQAHLEDFILVKQGD